MPGLCVIKKQRNSKFLHALHCSSFSERSGPPSAATKVVCNEAVRATMTSGPTQEEVDDILGAALDALDDLDGGSDDRKDTAEAAETSEEAQQPSTGAPAESAQASTQGKVYYGPEPPPPEASVAASSPAQKPAASLEDAMSQLLRAGEALQKSAGGVGDVDDIDLNGAEKMLDEIMDQLQLGGLGDLAGEKPAASLAASSSAVGGGNDKPSSSSSEEGKNTDDAKPKNAAETKASGAKSSAKKAPSSSSPLPKSSGACNSADADVDRAVQRLLSDMAKAGSGDNDDDAIPDLDALMNGGNVEAMGEEMMESMMKELSAFGASGDADDVVDGMMRQLLSKELMYEPMKQVCDRFPAWLAESKAHLSEEEYQK